jgi:superfamily II DNA or RNA helicase
MPLPVVLGSRLYVPKELIERDFLERWYYHWEDWVSEDEVDEFGDLVLDRKGEPKRKKVMYERSLRGYWTVPTVNGSYYAFPRGNRGKIIPFIRPGHFIDMRASHPFTFQLRVDPRTKKDPRWPPQRKCVYKWLKKGYGVVEGGTGSGKTVIGIGAISMLGQCTLLLTKRLDAYEQWDEELREHTNVDEVESQLGSKVIGPYSSKSRRKRPYPITIGTVQSFLKERGRRRLLNLQDKFGLLVLDEVHELCTPKFLKAITSFDAHSILCLTATPQRNDFRHLLMHDAVGPIVATNEAKKMDPEVTFIYTGIKAPGWVYSRPYADHYRWIQCLNLISGHEKRTDIIRFFVEKDAEEGRVICCYSERRAIIQELYRLLKAEHYKVAYVDGTTKNRKEVYNSVKKGQVQILCAGKVMDALVNIPQIDCLHVCTPINNQTTLEQIYGRSSRYLKEKLDPWVRHYIDDGGQLSGAGANAVRICELNGWVVNKIRKDEVSMMMSSLWIRPGKK